MKIRNTMKIRTRREEEKNHGLDRGHLQEREKSERSTAKTDHRKTTTDFSETAMEK